MPTPDPSSSPRGRLLRPRWITEDDCRAAPDQLFVFGDNMQRWGKKGQSVIRDEPNAVGVVTKWMPKAGRPDAYFSDRDAGHPQVVAELAKAFRTLAEALRNGIDVAIPAAGLGAGLAELPTRAPRVQRMIDQAIARLAAIADGLES